MLTPVADGIFVNRSELLRNLTVVVHGRAGAPVADPGITAPDRPCQRWPMPENHWRGGPHYSQRG